MLLRSQSPSRLLSFFLTWLYLHLEMQENNKWIKLHISSVTFSPSAPFSQVRSSSDFMGSPFSFLIYMWYYNICVPFICVHVIAPYIFWYFWNLFGVSFFHDFVSFFFCSKYKYTAEPKEKQMRNNDDNYHWNG